MKATDDVHNSLTNLRNEIGLQLYGAGFCYAMCMKPAQNFVDTAIIQLIATREFDDVPWREGTRA